MNKQQLIDAIANEVDVTKATAAGCLDAFINTVTKVLKKKGEVRLVGFGTFATAKRKATTGRNPQTGEAIKIPASTQPKFILDFTEKYNMSFPGWEPERMAKLDELFKAYADVDHEKLWANLKYFLEALMPTCEETGIKMAIHMDDPPWDIFGLPRLLINEENIDRFLKMVDHPCNCLTLCSGSLNADPNNDVASIVRKHCDRIAFAHIRNVKHFPNGDFSEASHRDCDGDTGILEILKAYHDCGFEGYIRPDHGRHLWDEGPGNVRPGYGLYDRALGIMYMLGVWDMLEKLSGK